MDFKRLSKLSYKEIKEETIIHYPEVRDFCSLPYPDHPKGCPNIKKCQMLDVPYFGEILKIVNQAFIKKTIMFRN